MAPTTCVVVFMYGIFHYRNKTGLHMDMIYICIIISVHSSSINYITSDLAGIRIMTFCTYLISDRIITLL